MANMYPSRKAIGGIPTLQSKSVTATTSAQTVSPDSGYDGLSSVTVNPQVHSETYTPAMNTALNDMGANHNKRYVNTSGMIIPSGNKPITANGTGIDVSAYATVSVSVPITSITPDDDDPVALAMGNNYTPTAPGYAYSSRLVIPTQTLLWSNSSPSSSFGSQTITLSDSMTNYYMLRIVYKISTSVATQYEYWTDATYDATGTNAPRPCLAVRTSGDITVHRNFTRNAINKIAFQAASASGTSYNGYAIPLYIYGINGLNL